MSHFVTMVDNFMSGWGPAKGKTNIYMVVCDTQGQADRIVKAGNLRDEMTNVKDRGTTEPYYNKRRYLVTEKHFNDLGPFWTGGQYHEL